MWICGFECGPSSVSHGPGHIIVHLKARADPLFFWLNGQVRSCACNATSKSFQLIYANSAASALDRMYLGISASAVADPRLCFAGFEQIVVRLHGFDDWANFLGWQAPENLATSSAMDPLSRLDTAEAAQPAPSAPLFADNPNPFVVLEPREKPDPQIESQSYTSFSTIALQPPLPSDPPPNSISQPAPPVITSTMTMSPRIQGAISRAPASTDA